MSIKRVVYFTGKAGCGKTYCSDYFVKRWGFKRMSFATPLKHMLEVMGVPRANLFGTPQEKEAILEPLSSGVGKPISARYLMQTLGTEWGRDTISGKLWVHLLTQQQEWKETDRIVMDDVRFESEVECLKEAAETVGIEVVRHRERSVLEWVSQMFKSRHASEVGGVDTDFRVHNDGDQEYIYKQLDRVAKTLNLE